MSRVGVRRRIAWLSFALALLVLFAALAARIAWLSASEESRSDWRYWWTGVPEMTALTDMQMGEDAGRIIAGLNTRDPMMVGIQGNLPGVTTTESKPFTPEVLDSITAAFPPSGCGYSVENVVNVGEIGEKKVPGAARALPSRQVDVKVIQHCRDAETPHNREERTISLFYKADALTWELSGLSGR